MAPADKYEAHVAKVTTSDIESGIPTCDGRGRAQVTVTTHNPSFLEGDGFNIQWLLFILGFFCWITSLVACFLPCCRRPRFPTKSYKAGWIANMVLTHITLAALITLIVLCSVYSVSLSAVVRY